MGLASRSKDCCCCLGVKAGTLVLLYLDLFCVVCVLIAIFNGNSKDCGPLSIGVLLLFVIIVAGLFAVGKKKPSLLIPYFIIRIICAFFVLAIGVPMIFLEKKGLDFFNDAKSYSQAFDFPGERGNTMTKYLDSASSVMFALIIFEIVLIILEIHYAKVIYACYKKLEEELEAGKEITYAPLVHPYAVPYVHPLQQQPGQPTGQVPLNGPVYAC